MLTIADLPICPEGMNQQKAPWEIPDGQARWLEDVLLHRENAMDRRGPVKPATGWPTSATTRFIGIVATDDPVYQWRVAVLEGDSSSSYITALNTSYSTLNRMKWDEQSPQTVFFGGNNASGKPKRYKVATSSHMRGGALIGVQNFAGSKGQTSLGHWGGGALDAYSTGTIKSTSQDSTSVTGVGTSWVGNVEPGMFLYAIADEATGAGKNYIGQVKSVESNTALTLVDGALFAVTNGGTGRAYTIKSTRPLDRRVAKGTITAVSGETEVNGANTKFKRQLGDATATEKWALFRTDDMKYIGWVSTVASDTQLTLNAGALITCNKDKYVAINMKGDRTKMTTDATDFPWITATFAGRQWYANRPYSNKAQPFSASRVWFSDILEPEALDITADGDHILIPSTKPPIKPITGMIGLPTCLAVFKEDEVYAIFGTDESNFALRKIDCPDGAMNPMVLQPYQDGVIFAGVHGIWFFDGNECFDLTEDRMADWYEKAMEASLPRTYGAWSMLYKNTYFLYSDKADPPTGPDKTDNTTNAEGGTPADHLSLAINLERRAFTTLTNFAFHGAVRSPEEETIGTIYIVNKLSDTDQSLTGGRFCAAEDLFYADGLDTITTDLINAADDQLGPDLFWESKRYDVGRPQYKKRWKQMQMQYRLDSITGNYVTYGLDTTAFGGSTTSGSATGLTVGDLYVSKFTSTLDGRIDSMVIGLTGTGTITLEAVVYNDSSGPDTQFSLSEQVTATLSGSNEDVTLPMPDDDLDAGSYWLGFRVVAVTGSVSIIQSASGTNGRLKTGQSTSPNPFPASPVTVTQIKAYLMLQYGVFDYEDNYLKFATMVGFNELSTLSSGRWPITRAKNSSQVWKAAFQNRRLKFNKRSTHLGFKVYQANKTGIKRVSIGPSALAYKEMRPGRV